MDKEIKSLTGIRGIAALWVVFLHYFESIYTNKDIYVNKLFSNGIIAVDMFFLLSAFVMCMAYSEEFKWSISLSAYKVFIKKRLARVYPAYFFWVIMFLLIFDFSNLKFDYTKILVNLLLIQNLFTNSAIAGVFWSLSSEWIMYVIFPFLYFSLHKIKIKHINLLLILVCIIGIYLLPSMNNYFIDFHRGLHMTPPSGFVGVVKGFNSVLRCFFAYVIGINLFLLIRNSFSIVSGFWLRFFRYAAIIGLLLTPYFGKSVETYTFLFIYSIILIAVLYLDKEKTDPIFESRTVYFLGQISYSIYLCHMFILVFVSILAKKFLSIQFDILQPYLVIGSLILLIPISYLSYIFVEIKTGLWLKSKLFAKHSSKKYGFS